jgi:hypothetical protein
MEKLDTIASFLFIQNIIFYIILFNDLLSAHLEYRVTLGLEKQIPEAAQCKIP